MIVDPRFCAYCGTQTLTQVARGERSPFVGGECSTCQTVTLVDHDDAERAVGRAAPEQPTTSLTTRAQERRVTGLLAFGQPVTGIVRAIAMHDGSASFLALIEADDGIWHQVRAVTLRAAETPS